MVLLQTVRCYIAKQAPRFFSVTSPDFSPNVAPETFTCVIAFSFIAPFCFSAAAVSGLHFVRILRRFVVGLERDQQGWHPGKWHICRAEP